MHVFSMQIILEEKRYLPLLLLGDALFMLFQRIYLWLIKCLNPSQQHSCHGVLYYSDLDLIFKVTLVPILPKLGFHS